MKSFTSILGWLLLVALVAVPSFLFYNWVMQGKKKAAAETVSGSPAVNVFPPSQPAAAPQAPAAQPPAVQPVQAAAQPAAQPVQEAQQQAQAASEPAAQASAAQPAPEDPPSASANAPVVPAQPAQVSTAAEQAVEVSTAPKPRSWYEPKSDRDPTFSPADYRKLKEEQLQREEAAKMQRYAETHKPREPGPETKVKLTGIVGTAAILNDNMYYTGQTVRGTGVKVVKVGVDYVICDYKGKKFKKVMK